MLKFSLTRNLSNGIQSVLVCVCLTFASLSFASLHDNRSVHQHIKKVDEARSPELKLSSSHRDKRISFYFKGEKLDFKLENNDRFITTSKRQLRAQVALYKGRIGNDKKTWARFSKKGNQVSGVFFDGNELFMVSPYSSLKDSLSQESLRELTANTAVNDNTLLVVNTNDIEHNGTCALHDHSLANSFGSQQLFDDLNLATSSLASKEINLTLVADTEFVNTSDDAQAEMLAVVNVADGIFSEQLGIQLSVKYVFPLTDNGVLTSTDPQTLIVDFANSNVPNAGIRHLFTGKDLNGSTVGIAYVSALCNVYSVGITQRIGDLTSLVFTHELGHNFGAPHDNQSQSACSTTPGGFVMNPNINGAGMQFSACSISQMLPVIDYASNSFNACITPIVNDPPVITSSPGLTAEVGIEYAYDSDNRIDVEGDGPFTFTLDIAPSSMQIDNNGTITWTPTADDVGINPIQITVYNDAGQDTQYFEIGIEAETEVPGDFLSFNDYSIDSYGINQDKYGVPVVSDAATSLELLGNSWKSIAFDYDVTPNTMLELKFKSDGLAEIQGIGFDNDNALSINTTFNLYGSQNWGIQDFSYNTLGEFQTIVIPVGEFFRGSFNRLIFAMDNDANRADVNSIFKDIKVYESDELVDEPQALNFYELDVSSVSASQDGGGVVNITDDGFGIELNGNRWRKIQLSGQQITPTTEIVFEFKSTAEGEIHGLGFFTGSKENKDLVFQLYGSQNWGIGDYTYTGSGEFETFAIPIGQYFLNSNLQINFIMDNDASLNSNGTFRNIIIRH